MEKHRWKKQKKTQENQLQNEFKYNQLGMEHFKTYII